MAKVFIEEDTLTAIANAVRVKNGTTEPIRTVELATSIENLPSGGTVEPLEVTANGTYTPPEGVDGYAPVTVAVYDAEVPKITDASYLFYAGRRLDHLNELLPLIDNECKDFSYMFSTGGLATLPHELTSLTYFFTGNGTNFNYMFERCSKLTTIPLLDTSNGTNFSNMFTNCIKFKTMPLINTSNGTSFGGMFYNCRELKNVPLLDTSNGTNFSGMFNDCEQLTSAPLLDTSNGTNFSGMFNDCYKLENVPLLDTSNGTNFSNMFNDCHALTTIPQLDVSNGTDFQSMFSFCKALTEVPQLNTSKCTYFSSMFSFCQALTSVAHLDVNSGKGFSNMFSSCKALTNLYLYNIRASIQIGSGTSYGHLLTVDSLVHTIKELCTVTSTQTLTMGATNLAKIADLYCCITDDTNEKLTMELCESTNEGAITLTDYAAEKGWQFK